MMGTVTREKGAHKETDHEKPVTAMMKLAAPTVFVNLRVTDQ